MDVRLMPETNYNPAFAVKSENAGTNTKECAAKTGLSEGQLNRKLAGEYNLKSRRDPVIQLGTFWTRIQRKSDITFVLKIENNAKKGERGGNAPTKNIEARRARSGRRNIQKELVRQFKCDRADIYACMQDRTAMQLKAFYRALKRHGLQDITAKSFSASPQRRKN